MHGANTIYVKNELFARKRGQARRGRSLCKQPLARTYFAQFNRTRCRERVNPAVESAVT